MAVEVRDSLSNGPEQIEEAAKAVGRGERRRVFEAIYFHKTKAKTVSDIVKATGLTRMRVLQRAGELVKKGIVKSTKKDGEIAYEMISFFQAHKHAVLRLAGNAAALKKWPTKRKIRVSLGMPRSVVLPTAGADVQRITIDDIESFGRVKTIKAGESMSKSVSEDDFKRGIQAVVGEAGRFKDWGGEDSDLYSSRLRIGGKRMTVAFAFKGPGMPSKLVPGKMGKNGDQAQRLFRQDADIFLVQHWREIDPSVLELMRSLAVAKSLSTGRKIYYGVIDGQDSERLRQAYPTQFDL